MQSAPRDETESLCRVSACNSIARQFCFTSLGYWTSIKIIADSEKIKECIPAATDAVLEGKTKAEMHNEFKKRFFHQTCHLFEGLNCWHQIW